MSGSKFRFISFKSKSKNCEDLYFQIEETLLLKIDFPSDSFSTLPLTKRAINGGHHFSIYGEGKLEGAIFNVTTLVLEIQDGV